MIETNIQHESTPALIAELMDLFKGKGSSRDDETTVRNSGTESADGYVAVYSGRASDIMAILRRVGSKVLRFRLVTDKEHYGIFMEIDKSVFRGAGGCFKCVDNSEPMSEEVRARFAGVES
ncbi:MAG: hypothetical protein WC911_02215 [Thermoleophilia bacterium]